MSNAFLVSVFEHKAWCNQRFVEALRAAPSDADRRQMAIILLTFEHTNLVDQVFQAHLSGNSPPVAATVASRVPDLDVLAQTMSQTDAWYLGYVAQVSPAELETVVDFAFVDDGSPGRMTKAQMLAHVITHAAAHRGQINTLMEALNLRGAPDMVTTFVGTTGRPD